MSTVNFPAISDAISAALGITHPLIAVSFSDKLPDNFPAFQGQVAAGCSFWEAAGAGTIVTSPRDHELCSIGFYTHNLADPSPNYGAELTTVLKVLGDMNYVREEDVATIPVLQTRSKHVIYSPLATAPMYPDVVLLFARARQSLIVAEAVQQVDNGIPPAMGRPACAIIPQVINTSRAALSLGCCGARAYLSVLTDDVALWGLPGKTIDRYAERIVALAHANEVLQKFHSLRMQDVAEGRKPSYEQSLARLRA